MQLTLKTLHFAGELSGSDLAKRLALAVTVLDSTLEGLKRQRHVEVVGGTGPGSYRYRITDAGRSRAALLLEQSHYVGMAPVPLDQYRKYMDEFRRAVPLEATREKVKGAFSHIVVRDSLIDQIGPALNGGHSMFIYGPPGNGKTTSPRRFGTAAQERHRHPARAGSGRPDHPGPRPGQSRVAADGRRGQRPRSPGRASIGAGCGASARW